jgi:hypothetical protein
MQKIRWSDAAPIPVFGLIILALFLILFAAGFAYPLTALMSILTPLTALFLGVLGLRIYSQEPEMRQDRFHTLYLWISIGLIILALSEIAIVLFSLVAFSLQMKLTLSLIQMPGLLLWGVGILQYLKSVNQALEVFDSRKLWMELLIIASLATLTLFVIVISFMPWIGAVDSIVISPILMGQCLFTVVSLGLVWIFREGEIAKPLFLIFIGMLLYLIRTTHWAFSIAVIGTPVNSIIAFEAYLFLGTALILVRSLGNNTSG